MQALGCLRRPPPRLGLLRAPSGVSSFRRKACSAAQASPPQQHPLSRPKLLLGIESSCDDTGAAVVTSEGRVLGEDIAGQADIHAPWGGVVPNLAMEAHKAAIDRVVENALARAGVQASQLDAVAVTVGPGLSLCLRVGVVKAMALSATHRLPLVRVHHMEAHALVARLQDAYQPARPTPSTLIPTLTDHSPEASSSEPPLPGSQSDHSSNGSSGGSQGADVRTGVVPGVESHSNEYSSSNSSMSSSEGQCAGGSAISSSVPFPFLCLLVSGGHNLVVLVQGVGQYVQLGTTVDDALGEAFDKVARLLSLDLKPSGGAALERLAKEGDPNQFKFKVPMRKYNNANFSFAGLKTSVRMAIDAHINNAQPSSRPGAPLTLPPSSPSTTPPQATSTAAPSHALAPPVTASTQATGSSASPTSSTTLSTPSTDATITQPAAQLAPSSHQHQAGASLSDGAAGQQSSTAHAAGHQPSAAGTEGGLQGGVAGPQASSSSAESEPSRPSASSIFGASSVGPPPAALAGQAASSSTGVEDSEPSTSGRDPLRQVKADIAASFQHVATVHLMEKLGCAIQWAKESDPGLRHLVVAGGVACNQHIRGELLQLASKEGLELVLPPPKWCTDNGVMVAWAGHERLALGLQEPPPETSIVGDDEVWVDLKPRWPLTTEQHPAIAAAAAAAAASSSARKRRPKKAGQASEENGQPGAVAPAAMSEHRGERKARLHTSLTEMTAEALQAQQS